MLGRFRLGSGGAFCGSPFVLALCAARLRIIIARVSARCSVGEHEAGKASKLSITHDPSAAERHDLPHLRGAEGDFSFAVVGSTSRGGPGEGPECKLSLNIKGFGPVPSRIQRVYYIFVCLF